jgi:hypothetical protein
MWALIINLIYDQSCRNIWVKFLGKPICGSDPGLAVV